ncbi:MmgE/PrpD family protein [Pollutimonas bauzanensis]|nr:MmgE/PrpD family protein [Pollutimonas bauzanensis]
MASPCAAAPPSVLQKLARVVHDVHYDNLPPAVIKAAKDLILDTLGCAYGGFASPVAIALRKMAADCGGAEQATLIGTGGKTSAPLAALVNGSLLRYLDSNDYYFGRDPAHPSGNVAVALAVGEREGRSGKDLIAALVAAYEVHLRLCDFAGAPSLWRRGWHHGTNAQFSTSALAGRLSWDEPALTAHAMAIAGSHQNTLAQLQSGAVSMIKATAEAWVGKAGIEAAMLAGHGITGPLDLMEGVHGWAKSVAGEVDFDALAAAAPKHRYRILDASVKPYPAVATALAPIAAAIRVCHANTIVADDIQDIVVYLPGFALNSPSAHPGRRYPASIESAQHSFYYCAAVALLDGACGDAQFTEARLADETLRAVLAKVELREDPALNELWPQAAGGAVEVRMADGALYGHRCPYPPGHPRFPLSAAELDGKFYDYATPVLSEPGARALHDAIYRLEDFEDLRDLTRLLAPAA